jgi:hypothetical protein
MFELFDPEADFRVTHGTRLPHWYQPGVSYFVTFRTEDSIPVEVSRLWHARRSEWLARHGISPSDESWNMKLNQLSVIQRKDFHVPLPAETNQHKLHCESISRKMFDLHHSKV